MSHDCVSPFFHISDWVRPHGHVVLTHDHFSFTELLPLLGTPVFSHPYSSAALHARVFSPHGCVLASKSLSLDFHHPNSSQWTPWRQTNTISLKIHQLNPNNSSKNVESLYKISLTCYMCYLVQRSHYWLTSLMRSIQQRFWLERSTCSTTRRTPRVKARWEKHSEDDVT